MKTFITITILSLAACGAANSQNAEDQQPVQPRLTKEAIFAGGCFWCVEADFEKVDGVIEAVSGYTGGHTENPTYKQVTRGGTGHYEAAKITYDPAKISYNQLVTHFFKTHDPTDDGGQFCDRGESYRPAIFANESQLETAQAAVFQYQNSGILKGKVLTPVLKATPFYDAEDYHQNYYKKNPVRYKYYRNGCGRDKRIRKVWTTP